ncbi:hypothetical protein GCM10025778_10790 [Paeniglutamicibacter antarcticus]|uniref:Uncharacterized protein n=1 Tax=Paeniglutamicibacter antarcticus TaxID=494023 RepID=A0ABP9TK79_9MICC
MAKYGRSGAIAPATKAIGTKGSRRKGRTAAGWARVKGKRILGTMRRIPRSNGFLLRMGPASSLSLFSYRVPTGYWPAAAGPTLPGRPCLAEISGTGPIFPGEDQGFP